MIAVNVNAGLANQMFHYAFGRGLIAKGLDVCFDQTNFTPREIYSHETIKLQDAFPKIEIIQMPLGHFKWVFPSGDGRLINKYYSIMRKLHHMIGDEIYIMERCYAYTEGMEDLARNNCIYRGFWQSEKYFNHCEADVRKQFAFVPFDEEKNVCVSNKMSTENSVAIHLRKSKDYIQSPLTRNLCNAEYYVNAINYIHQYVANPKFYVFTDNPAWVRENLPVFDYTLVDWNEVSGKRSFRDMQLMSCCKHNIIANSTYSWWGAWLNPNPDKIVVAPKQFFNPMNDFFKIQDVVPDGWVKL